MRGAKAERICQLAEVVPPDDLMMTSSQVAALARAASDRGTYGKPSHPCPVGPSAARDEIQRGRQRLEAITGSQVRLFAYPNGRPGEDYTIETTELVRQMGFGAAFSTAHGVARRNADLFQLPRFTPWDRNDLKFGIRMARNLMNPDRLLKRRQFGHSKHAQ